MAPQPSKRRKLVHRPELDESNSDHGSLLSAEEFGDQVVSDDADDSISSQQDDETSGLLKASQATHRKQSHSVSGTLAFAGETYRSNLFKLQVEDLLANARRTYSRQTAHIRPLLDTIREAIHAIPEHDPLSIGDAERHIRDVSGIAIPFPHPRPSQAIKYKFSFKKPTGIRLARVHALSLIQEQGASKFVDVAVEMPKGLFQEKDYLNYRYSHKRAYYLARLAAGIKNSEQCDFRMAYDSLDSNPLQPVLVLESKKELSVSKATISGIVIRLIPTIEGTPFLVSKLLPSCNCVRSINSATDSAQGIVDYTPFYNATLLHDMILSKYHDLFAVASLRCGAFTDACALASIWLRQRGLASSICEGGFGIFEWACITAVLLQDSSAGPNLPTGYSSYQLFKAVLQFLSSSDLVRTAYISKPGGSLSISGTNGPIFFDADRGYNLLFKMSPWSYQLLRHEATMSMNMLHDPIFDAFEATFIYKADELLQRFDLVVRVPGQTISTTGKADDEPFNVSKLIQKYYTVLKKGLGDRVDLISIMSSESGKRTLQMKSFDQTSGVLIGLIFNPSNATRVVDHGPAAEAKKEAAEFRKFWGEKAELRRFQDGGILESVIWTQTGSKTTIIEQIISHLLHRHLGLKVGDDFSFVEGTITKSNLLPARDFGLFGNTLFKNQDDWFRRLEEDIRKLQDMPLQLRQISAVGSVLRYSSVSLPDSHGSRTVEPADVVIQFESSPRWPDELVAIQRTKIAFLLKLGDLLDTAVEGVTTQLGLENEARPISNSCFLDVCYDDGASFRLRIHHDREQTLLERRLKDRSLEQISREESANALSIYARDFIQRPLHSKAIRTLCLRFPALSGTIRLVKQWFDSHLLSNGIREELVELLVVRNFLQPYPWKAPASLSVGFFRTILFLSRWDWRNEPLIADLNSSLTQKNVEVIRTRFEAWRRIDPAMNRVTLFVASGLDISGTVWTDPAPSKLIAGRMTALAKAAYQTMKGHGLGFDHRILFASSTSEYDFLLQLNPRFVKQSKQAAKNGDFKNIALQTAERSRRVSCDYITPFIREVDNLYGKDVTLFYNIHGGRVIGGLWNPSTERSFKINIHFSPIPAMGTDADSTNQVAINRTSTLNDIGRLGGDLLEGITFNKNS